MECVSVGEKSSVKIINEEVKESSSVAEEIKIRKCRRKIHVGIINEEMKVISCEEEMTGINKCRERSRVDIINEEVKGWTSSSKQQEAPPESTKTKEGVRLEEMKKGRKISSRMGWFFLQEELKSLMYVDRS